MGFVLSYASRTTGEQKYLSDEDMRGYFSIAAVQQQQVLNSTGFYTILEPLQLGPCSEAQKLKLQQKDQNESE